MKKIICAMLVAALLLCGLTGLAEDYEGRINTLIEQGSFIVQIPDVGDDMGWYADEMAQDDTVVKLYDADVIEDTFVARYDATGDGDVTVGVRHFYNGFACDVAYTWDLHVENGAVQEVTGGSQKAIASDEEQTALLEGTWEQKEAPFAQLTLARNEARGWDVEIVSPGSANAYVFKTTIYADAETSGYVYDKGKYWAVGILDTDEDVELGEATQAGTSGTFALSGTQDRLELTWTDSLNPELDVTFVRPEA